MSDSSPLQQAVTVAPGIRMRLGKSERGEPVVQVCTKQAFAAGEITDVETLTELEALHVFLGAAIARLRSFKSERRALA